MRTAGLLHETGSLVLAAQLPERYAQVLAIVEEETVSVHEAENRVFGATHSEIGAYLLGIWGLPDAIVEAVAFHHAPGSCPAQKFGALTAVHLADYFDTVNSGRASMALDTRYLANLGLLDQLQTFEDRYEQTTGG